MTHRITLERNTLRFAAAHFTASPSECEPLHGHNYDVFVEIEGGLTEDSWVIDFGKAKAMVRDLCQHLDHKFLAPTQSTVLNTSRANGELTIEVGARRYVMPEADVAFIDVDSTTAERLAGWIAAELVKKLGATGAASIQRVTVGVEEMPGQAGWFTQEVPAHSR